MLGFTVSVYVFTGVLLFTRANEVDNAIENVGDHYNDKLCLDLLLVDCTKHVTQHDEEVCGSDGKTYANHCVFIHAMCEYHYSSVTLMVQHTGSCGHPTTPPLQTTTHVPALIIQDIFCQHADTISCTASNTEIICTTSGILVPNQCEFAKLSCKDQSLAIDHSHSCFNPGK